MVKKHLEWTSFPLTYVTSYMFVTQNGQEALRRHLIHLRLSQVLTTAHLRQHERWDETNKRQSGAPRATCACFFLCMQLLDGEVEVSGKSACIIRWERLPCAEAEHSNGRATSVCSELACRKYVFFCTRPVVSEELAKHKRRVKQRRLFVMIAGEPSVDTTRACASLQ